MGNASAETALRAHADVDDMRALLEPLERQLLVREGPIRSEERRAQADHRFGFSVAAVTRPGNCPRRTPAALDTDVVVDIEQ